MCLLNEGDERAEARAHLDAGGVLLLWSRIDEALPVDAGLLTARDRAAIRRLHFEQDRHALSWSRAVTRWGFALLGAPTDAEPTRSPFGRPKLEGASFAFSPSRTQTVVACAYKRSGPLGLDIETRHRLGAIEDLVPHMMCAAEREALRRVDEAHRENLVLATWTRKEAILKAIGCGLSLSPDAFAVDFATGRISGLRDASGRDDACWRFDERWLTGDVHCSVALADDASVTVRSFRAETLHAKKPRIEA